MGRGVQADPIPGPGQQSQKGDTDGPLAVGAGHMHIAQGLLGMPNPGQKGAHGIKPQLYFMKLEIIQISLCFLEIHQDKELFIFACGDPAYSVTIVSFA